MLLLCEHSHHDERVQVDAFAEHPEVVAAQHIHVEKLQDLTADLQREQKKNKLQLIQTPLTSQQEIKQKS